MLSNLIVPVLNRYDLLNRMLGTIDYPVKRLVIIDNGGRFEQLFDKPTLDLVEQTFVLTLPSNLGVAGSWNLGIKLLPHDQTWTITSNDVYFQPGDLEILSQASGDRLSLSEGFPHYHTFAVGEAVVGAVGLFDERLTPAYFEDNDYERRVRAAGFEVDYLPVRCGHDNSSTLKSSEQFQRRNAETFESNRAFYEAKVASDDMSWGWDLARRRAGEWRAVD